MVIFCSAKKCMTQWTPTVNLFFAMADLPSWVVMVSRGAIPKWHYVSYMSAIFRLVNHCQPDEWGECFSKLSAHGTLFTLFALVVSKAVGPSMYFWYPYLILFVLPISQWHIATLFPCFSLKQHIQTHIVCCSSLRFCVQFPLFLDLITVSPFVLVKWPMRYKYNHNIYIYSWMESPSSGCWRNATSKTQSSWRRLDESTQDGKMVVWFLKNNGETWWSKEQHLGSHEV